MTLARFAEHPRRRQVVGEMHLRRFPAFAPPAQIVQIVRLVPDALREAERAVLSSLPGSDDAHARHREAIWAPGIRLLWERHSEASTVTLILHDAGADWTAPLAATVRPALDWVETLPGEVIRATHMIVVDREADAGQPVASAGFRTSQCISCHVGGSARLWSDFRIHDDGYGRLVVAANGLAPADLARGIQRLQELGNYRNLALLGLPVAQEAWGRLDDIERRLGEAGRALTARAQRDDDLLLAFSTATEQLLSLSAESDFRMSATAAYAEIVADRLAELDVRPIEGFPSLADFTERRFNPAIRTCAAFGRRLDRLNDRAAQFVALLRTRIETNIENQNGRLLASLDDSARMQLRLQHLVEGLSAVAISYYLLGLIGYPLKALDKTHLAPSSTLLLGLTAPFVVATVFLTLRAMRRRLVGDDGKPAPNRA